MKRYLPNFAILGILKGSLQTLFTPKYSEYLDQIQRKSFIYLISFTFCFIISAVLIVEGFQCHCNGTSHFRSDCHRCLSTALKLVKTNYTNIYTQQKINSHQKHLIQTIDHRTIDLENDSFLQDGCASLGSQWEPLLAAIFLVGGVGYAALWSDSIHTESQSLEQDFLNQQTG